MYEEYFGLNTKPFSIVPDPRYFYMSNGHSEALAHLVYGIKNDVGFVLLTGEVGTGKTTVCKRFLQMLSDDTEIAFILNPKLTVVELLAIICDEFGISYPKNNQSVKVFVDLINEYLLDIHSKNKKAVLIIEEAQNLKQEVLEQIRVLTNLETNERKLLQIIMIGQPELRDMLSKEELRQLSQRITARYHLGPLNIEEVSEYINFRLSVAGLIRGRLFPKSVIRHLYRVSNGVPRLINVICNNALLGTYVQNKERVDIKTLKIAAKEVLGKKNNQKNRRMAFQLLFAGLFLILCIFLGMTYRKQIAKALPLTINKETSQNANLMQNEKRKNTITATLEIPNEQIKAATEGMAYKRLFEVWNIKYAQGDGRNVCEQAIMQGLRCNKDIGTLDMMRQMNKPAVLKLQNENNSEYYATLISLNMDTAVLSIGNETKTVDNREVIKRWSGDYLLLWRAPDEYKGALRPGKSGAIVKWLENRLAHNSGQRIYNDSNINVKYEGDLVKQVKRLQLANGIIPDGIVGTKTMMLLGGRISEKDPVLYSGKEGG